jgi:hypothetical protein
MKETVKNVIAGKTTGAKLFEIIADLSLCLDKLYNNDIKKINKSFLSIVFEIVERKDSRYISMKNIEGTTRLERQADFYNDIKHENDYRKEHNQPIITYNSEKIKF